MAGEEETNGADVDLKLAGQEVKLKNIKSLNTLATVATLIVVCSGAAYGYSIATAHIQETREGSRELVMALKDMTVATREQNCLLALPIDKRNIELCRRIAR